VFLPQNRFVFNGRRAGGAAVSVSLHCAAALLAARMVTSTSASKPEKTVLVITTVSPSDPLLLERSDVLDSSSSLEPSLVLPGFHFDISKVSSRRNVLFPFVTTPMTFLDAAKREVSVRRSHLANPFAAGTRTSSTSRPPLRLTDAALDRVVDRAWSRRDRWSKFGEIVRLIQEHDADEGRAADLVHGYRDRNILQPVCDYRIVRGPPRRETIIPDHMLWMMLENAADVADFVDFVHAFARAHPSSRTTTELLFILDKLVQANRDALLEVVDTNTEDLSLTSSVNPAAFDLFRTIQQHYIKVLNDERLTSHESIKRKYDDVRFGLLSAIAETTPNGYRSGDARFLIGELLFNQGRTEEAVRWWRGIVPDPGDSYSSTYAQLMKGGFSRIDEDAIQRVLHMRQAEWRLFFVDRLRHFGSACDAFQDGPL